MSVRRSTALAGAAAVGLVMVLQGCAQQQARPSTTRLYAADQIGGARTCTVPQVTVVNGQETATAMTVGNDGGWCAITVDNGGRPFSAGLLTSKPAHGRVYIHTVGDATRIDYTPTSGYAGPDTFTVRLLPGEGSIRAAVTVTRG